MTNCIESSTCMPTNPLDVLNIFDIWFGNGMSLMVMALIIGVITLGIYVRTRSLSMLTILGIYEIAAFGVLLTNKLISSQYQILIAVLILGGGTGFVMLYLRLVKE